VLFLFGKGLTCADNSDAVHGMPVGLQIAGRRLEEEKVLAMAGVILDALKC
jgi:amidase